MKQLSSIIFAVLLTLASCSKDEPAAGHKAVEERTVLLVDAHGNIYNLEGELIKTLPDCSEVIQIITEGEDYFVSGRNTKQKVGYWKNGKWNTLHVDFIDDIEHETFGIAKWDYNIYLLDPPNVLRNSGIFPLENHENFVPARHGISVSEGYCFVVGNDYVEINDLTFKATPILYYFKKGGFKKKVLPLPAGISEATVTGVCAFEGNHYLACGYSQLRGMVWDDNDNIQIMEPYSSSSEITMANAVERINGHTYVAGVESPDGVRLFATLWTDNTPQQLIYTPTPNSMLMSYIADIQGYDKDIYTLVQETLDTYEIYTVVWLNGEPIAKIDKPLISIAIY